MGFYREPVAVVAPRARAGALRVRVRSDSLGAINPVLSLINQRYGMSIGVTQPAPLPTAPKITGSIALPLISTPAPAPAPITIRTFSPSTPPTPTPTPAPPPPPSTPYNEPASPPPSTYTPPSSTGGGSSSSGSGNAVDTAAQAAQTAAPIIAATAGPAAGAAAALAPAFSNAFNADPSVSFAMPDAEVYNSDGTPVTPAAKAASTPTLAQKFAALPPAAKIGGAVVLYLLFSRR